MPDPSVRLQGSKRAPGATERIGAMRIEVDGEHHWFVPAVDAQLTPQTVVCLDCETWASPSCADYFGHGTATLEELMDAFSNP